MTMMLSMCVASGVGPPGREGGPGREVQSGEGAGEKDGPGVGCPRTACFKALKCIDITNRFLSVHC